MTDPAACAGPRVALIHALAHSMAPITQAFAQGWPQARLVHLLDDSLSADLARSGTLDEAMHRRFMVLADYAVDSGAQAIVFTCSAFGPCIAAVARRHAGLPVLRPNEAMIDDVVAQVGRGSGRIGLVASFGPTLQTMPAESPHDAPPLCALAEGAMAALDAGDAATHDRLAAEASAVLAARGCRAIALAQFSLARAAPAVATRTGLPVFTTPDSAVNRLRRQLGAMPAAA
jgi:hypothetical protein